MLTVIHHSADWDGLFCREIARRFLPAATTFIGWDYKDDKIPFPTEGRVYVLDLSPECFIKTPEDTLERLIWIDHHKTAIDNWPSNIPGYRIDGVAACRLAWQHFSVGPDFSKPDWKGYPSKQAFIERTVREPWAVRLAGEYDIWDKRDSDAELFQHGLRSEELNPNTWDGLLSYDQFGGVTVVRLLNQGRALQFAKRNENESIIREIGFTLQWEGLTFLACNAARYNSLLFTDGLTDHDACLGFKWTGRDWSVSLYHAPGQEHHDLSVIAKKYGGGGHRGACGFRLKSLPWLT